MFPALGAHAKVRPVVERLAEEHVVIHEHLVHVDELAARLESNRTSWVRPRSRWRRSPPSSARTSPTRRRSSASRWGCSGSCRFRRRRPSHRISIRRSRLRSSAAPATRSAFATPPARSSRPSHRISIRQIATSFLSRAGYSICLRYAARSFLAGGCSVKVQLAGAGALDLGEVRELRQRDGGVPDDAGLLAARDLAGVPARRTRRRRTRWSASRRRRRPGPCPRGGRPGPPRPTTGSSMASTSAGSISAAASAATTRSRSFGCFSWWMSSPKAV